MSDGDLTQSEADALLEMEKCRVDDTQYIFPGLGGSLRIPLKSKDQREDFMLDISRGRIELKKNTFQNRTRQTVILARVDIGGPPHRNPNDEEVPCPHIHLYREGYADKWTFALPSRFLDPSIPAKVLDDFLAFCNIADVPIIQLELFV